MISALALTRSYSARLALGVLKNDSPTETNTSPASRLLNSLGFSDSTSTRLDSKTLSIIMQALQNQGDGVPAGDNTRPHTTGAIGSKDFMAKLKDQLTTGGSSPMSYVNNQQMLKAMKDGTLTVTNPATGKRLPPMNPMGTSPPPNPTRATQWPGTSSSMNI